MKLKNLLFITLGIIFMIVGMVGIFLPILPTTPFLIMSSVLFAKGSERFDIWFRNTEIYKNYAEDFINDRSMTLIRKIKILLLADFMLAFPFIMTDNMYLRVFIIVIAFFKWYYFTFKIKTKVEMRS